MRSTVVIGTFGLVAYLFAAADPTSHPEWVTPIIQQEGKVVALPDAVVPPQAGSKAIFDVTSHTDQDKVAKGLVRVARWINLNATADVDPSQIEVVVIIHGDATRMVLRQEAYIAHTNAKTNPGQQLLEQLEELGVDIYVCGQALAHHRYSQSEVLPEVKVASAALTVLIEKQQDGYAYLPY